MVAVTVIGAGAAGLCVATEIAARGGSVRLVDRGGGPGPHACSWWAGGMLAPFCEGESAEEPVVRLGQQAADWWERHAGGVTREGTLVVALGRDRAELDRFARRTEGHETLGPERIGELEPDLAGRFSRALFFAEEAHIDPRRALASLAERLAGQGVSIRAEEIPGAGAIPPPHPSPTRGGVAAHAARSSRSSAPIPPLAPSPGRDGEEGRGVATGEESSSGAPGTTAPAHPSPTRGEGGAAARGAQSSANSAPISQVAPSPPSWGRAGEGGRAAATGEDSSNSAPTSPPAIGRDASRTIIDCRGLAARDALRDLRGVKGEMLVLRCPDVRLSRPVRLLHPRIPLYIVPRGDGVYMLGATVVEASERGRVTARSLLELLSVAYALHPAFGEAEVLEIGVDARPAFPDNLPRVRVVGDTIHANGLFRHGFLLGPALAMQVADLIFDGKTPEFSDENLAQRVGA